MASPGQLISIPAGVDIRESNSVMYRIELNNFYGLAYYAFGELEFGTRTVVWSASTAAIRRASGALVLATTSAPTAPAKH